jgi:hypothetical protein
MITTGPTNQRSSTEKLPSSTEKTSYGTGKRLVVNAITRRSLLPNSSYASVKARIDSSFMGTSVPELGMQVEHRFTITPDAPFMKKSKLVREAFSPGTGTITSCHLLVELIGISNARGYSARARRQPGSSDREQGSDRSREALRHIRDDDEEPVNEVTIRDSDRRHHRVRSWRSARLQHGRCRLRTVAHRVWHGILTVVYNENLKLRRGLKLLSRRVSWCG